MAENSIFSNDFFSEANTHFGSSVKVQKIDASAHFDTTTNFLACTVFEVRKKRENPL